MRKVRKLRWTTPEFAHIPLGAEVTAYVTAPYPRIPV
ncbi:MAG: pyrroloquinoline quinone precursor peptide PqqA [Candidatus Eremiobacteraeota bacterium]|nr:pyrroloquinoline quinone precursor peptide PqqA [Candidatus Eremiobacteraeota bacterium]MBV8459323.1 pyrroloquinoline quinone precursor peptide PqqA [Candidatus Eremiobacteraeota bacterium]